MNIPSSALNAILMIMARKNDVIVHKPSGEEPLNRSKRNNPTYAPTIKTSPWAKLINFKMPYTIVYPRAIRA
ncbi:hypothetical protein DSECCO2_503640 [anaerobic digester metagenome]